MDRSSMTMRDILEPEEWAELIRPLKQALGAAPCVFDADNTRITAQCVTSPACALILNTAEGKRRCDASQAAAARRASLEGRPVMTYCHARFSKALAPVSIDGRTVGTLGACNFRLDDEQLDLDFLRELARELDLDEELFVSAGGCHPTLQRGEMELQLARIQELVDGAVERLLRE